MKRTPTVQAVMSHEGEPLHFRLCHFCHFLNEASFLIVRCKQCRRPLTLLTDELEFHSLSAPSEPGDDIDSQPLQDSAYNESDTQADEDEHWDDDDYIQGEDDDIAGHQLYGLTALF